MPKNTASDAELGRREAESIARTFNLAFNNAVIYGAHHPSVKKSLYDFLGVLIEPLNQSGMISLMLHRESLFVDQWRVDMKIHARKLLDFFTKSGVQSISFEKGLTGDLLRAFFPVLVGSDKKVERIQNSLAQRNITNIKINYVFYRKITSDETVVQKDSPDARKLDTERARKENFLLQNIGTVISLKDLAEKPKQFTEELISVIGGTSEVTPEEAITALRYLNREISEIDKNDGPLSVEVLSEVVMRLKMDLRDSLAVQKQLGKLAEGKEQVLDQVDRMSYEVIVKIMQEEYRNGSVSAKRLANLIRRMIPDLTELKKLLPLLKRGLFAEGMQLPEYLALLEELNEELQSETVISVLKEGAEDIGISLERIVEGMKSDPGEAARLIYLASTIRKDTNDDEVALSNLLISYIEAAGRKMAATSEKIKEEGNPKILEAMLLQLEEQLLGKLHEQGLPDDLVKQIDSGLSTRFKQTLEQLKTDWMVTTAAEAGELTGTHLVRLLDTVADQQIDISTVTSPLEQSLFAKGYTRDQVKSVVDEFTRKYNEEQSQIMIEKPSPKELPTGILSANNTRFFLQRFIKEHIRYGNPFSVLAVSVVAERTEKAWTIAERELTEKFRAHVYTELRGILRDLDLVGSLTPIDNVPFALLPMTDAEGCKTACDRVTRRFSERFTHKSDTGYQIKVAVTAQAFDRTITPGEKSFLEHLTKQHAKYVKRAKREIVESA